MTWLLAFVAAAMVDAAWVLSVDSVRTQPPLQSAMASGFFFMLAAGTTVLYTESRVLLIPASLGAACGTFAAIGWLRRRDGV